jgi:Zn-dependent peptidase ImmA (M78 family)
VICRADDVPSGAYRVLEREANVFAAELLMPEDAVRATAGDPDPAARFGISNEPGRWRLYSFGLAEQPAK